MAMVDFEDPMNFGIGVQALQHKVRGGGVIGGTPKSVLGGDGQTVQFSLLKVDSYEDYQSAFNFDAEASAVYGLFHASAKFNFAESHNFHSYSKYLVASIVVTNAFKQIPDPKLTDSARSLLATGAKDRFHAQFGDSFVLGIKTGGEYHAVLEFSSQTQEDLTKISAALEAGQFGLFSAEATFSSAVQRFKGQTSLKVDSFQQGGVDTNQTINVDEIIKKAREFPTQVKQVAVPYQAFLQDYEALDLPPELNLVQIENARLVLQRFLPLRNALVQKLNDIEYIFANPDQFEDVATFDLATMETNVTNALNELTQRASACVNNPTDCQFTPLTINPHTLALPKRKAGGSLPTTRMPNLAGLTKAEFNDVTELMVCLGHSGGFDACLAGTQFTGPDDIVKPLSIPADVAAFVKMDSERTLNVTWVPARPDSNEFIPDSANDPDPFPVAIASQFPAPGAEVTPGSQIIVNLRMQAP
jgi:hypothetical protein